MKIRNLLVYAFLCLTVMACRANGTAITAGATAFQDGNPPSAAIDNDLATRWSAQGNARSLRLDFETPREIGAVEIAFPTGSTRNSFFTLETSADGSVWETVFEGQSGGKSTDFERFTFTPTQARSVRYTGYGNSDNDWNSISEIRTITAENARPSVTFATLFCDHAVLQRRAPVPIWGNAAPSEIITVTFREHELRATADKTGRWSVTLPPMETGAPAELTARGKANEARASDVVVGEVWLCSGQSNMAFRLEETGERAEIANAKNSGIRHFFIPQTVSLEPAAQVKGAWAACTPENAAKFTATGYFFAKEINARLGVPIGLINASVGGTQIESWMSARALASDPSFAIVRERWTRAMSDYPQRRADYAVAMDWWVNASGKDRLAAARLGKRKPTPPSGPAHRDAPSSLFNGMVHPLVPYSIAGILWDQGGANAARANEYAALFKTLITDWRALWNKPALPFYFAQDANYRDPNSPGDNRARLREAQSAALTLPATGMAVGIDIGESDNVHPRNKRDLGKRLALIARAKIYGETTLIHSGPVFLHATVKGKTVRAYFEIFGQKMIARKTPLAGFELAGADGIFHAARARIDGNCILLTSESVIAPVSLRYAWNDDPPGDLAGESGLPAAPFRATLK